MASDRKKVCFVIGPIGLDGTDTRIAADWLLKAIIRPVLVAHGYSVVRADEIKEPGLIDVQVINNILDAELVIADLSEQNANAFYELALRHMAGRPIIHMINKSHIIPFDVGTFRSIKFSTKTYEELEDAKRQLDEQVREVQKEGFEVINPVIIARGRKEFSIKATSAENILQAEVDTIKDRMRMIEEELLFNHTQQVSIRTNPIIKGFSGDFFTTIATGEYERANFDIYKAAERSMVRLESMNEERVAPGTTKIRWRYYAPNVGELEKFRTLLKARLGEAVEF